ncbi:MAG: LpxI family protein [Paracoccus sp. (in: a-proteobacteria)]|uniref:LpxI family protein n=1 Tax=unclassified Paracoccus (in: a-proteobacteria) TaxID=2688777 RepID=UPI000C4AE09A|nr:MULTISPECIES: UDP-2,3-diacylglucosamine diphosphatase LpxI [unclassified Paracoccus (in: a-proteobacteria)]MAN57751.1 phosphatidate cytidylyltransferase [Paracoccus sp. (in: a-proteobacteria)]MBA48498.1 phosphatidate cytidylyltransferase [Paracoccus sp. (in: a-proteobacteria)]MDB2551829.1 UDP-2,3-diacylglucosamine diphosphatase LpxI [Paracoccus sp. (in: a-proteobacteria)]|tara:strand:- start:452 stop:1261 length:810 start_codon:yes stop_codon:yes gene_type:complete
MSRTAVIAGQGGLAPAVIAALDDPLVYALDGFAPPVPATPFRLERLVPFLDRLIEHGVDRVIFAGAVRRPRLDPEAFDPRTAQLVPRILTALQSGDDAALRMVLDIFEEHGLTICGVDQIAPDLVPEAGILTGAPTDSDRRDAARAARILSHMGDLDLGQGAVVAQGLCMALETQPGTAAMLDFAARHTGLRPDPTGAKGVFYKAPKPGQDRRVDLPTIGPDSVDQAAAADLAGIAWQAGGVILLDRQQTVQRARAAGLFLWARPQEGI